MKKVLGFGVGIAMLLLIVPLVHADLIYGQTVDDAPPFWVKLFSTQSGYFYSSSDPGDVYCRATWECVKTSDGKYKFDCYSSGGSGTGCLCYTTTDSSKCAINQPTSTSTQTTTSGSCNLGSGGTLTSGSSKCVGTIKLSCNNGVLSSLPDPSCGTVVQSTQTGAISVATCVDGTQQCSGSTAQICYKGQWTTATDCAKTGAGCFVYSGKTSCINFQTGSYGETCSPTKLCSNPSQICDTSSGTCVDFLSNPNIWINNIEKTAQTTQGTSSTLDKIKDFLAGGGGGSTAKQRDITDAEVKELNEGSLLLLDAEKIKAATTCASDSSCQSNHCVSLQKAGVSTSIIQKYTLGQVFGVCYSGSGIITSPNIPSASKSLSLTFKEWSDTSAAQRLKTLCKTKDDCAAYSDVSGTEKEYSVACNAARTQAQLQDDVDKICESTGTDKYLAVGGGASGAAVGCLVGGAAGAVAGGVGAIPGCIVGAIATGTVIVTTVEGIHNTLQISCKQKTIPSDVGACIATPKGGIGLDWLTEEHNIFGQPIPTWGIAVGILILLMLLPAILGGGKK